MALDRVLTILETCSQEDPLIPPTDLYNEGWMLRIILDWFSKNKVPRHPLNFPENGNWFSEELLRSAFLPRHRGDKFAESWTHADGVIGHFNIGQDGRGDLTLKGDATHFVVLEAKMFSKLSAGTTHASYYNQATRYVGCIAETLSRAHRKSEKLNTLGFYVLASKSQIERGIFKKYMNREHIEKTVKRQVDEYDEQKDPWFDKWFQPTIEKIDIKILSWEEIFATIRKHDSAFHSQIQEFYNLCLHFNSASQY